MIRNKLLIVYVWHRVWYVQASKSAAKKALKATSKEEKQQAGEKV